MPLFHHLDRADGAAVPADPVEVGVGGAAVRPVRGRHGGGAGGGQMKARRERGRLTDWAADRDVQITPTHLQL